MTDKKNVQLPVFSWENLATFDIEVAKKFYQCLFDWEVTSIPTGEYGSHCFFSANGSDVCSVSEIKNIHNHQPYSQWVPYISVPSIKECSDKSRRAGGRVIGPISPVADGGQTAVLTDPTDATFAIWHPTRMIETSASTAGMPCFHELLTSNMDIAGMFYANVFDWSPRAENFGDITYILFDAAGTTVASMMGVPGKDVHPRWVTYWRVQDCDKSIKKALELGGNIAKTVDIIKRRGRYAVLTDPLGAVFGIMQPTP
ncbi:MAG: VOC family protein [Bdellovibrio sp.]|nr:VOC family protein [Bdellovibrio sp.]